MAYDRDVQVAEYEYDFATDGGDVGVIPLRNLNTTGTSGLKTNCTVIDVQIYVETGLGSGGAATIELGDATDPDGYRASIPYSALTTGQVLGMWQLEGVIFWDSTKPKPFRPAVANDTLPQITVSAAALTAGKFKIRFCYIQD